MTDKTWTGTSGNDEKDLSIFNRGKSWTMYGFEGNDTLKSGRQNDILDGGEGHDHLDGRWGNDTLYGANGDDYLDGSDGLTGGQPF